MKRIKLNDGNSMPVIGMGFYQVKSENCNNIIVSAIDSGYRSFDTANAYFNEVAIGKAVSDSGVKREDIFITTKLWTSDYGLEKTPAAIDATLRRLNVDYIDLLLLHQEYGDYTGAWKAMENTVKEGKVKSIGLSNFRIEKVQEIIDIAHILPAVNQVQCHPYNQQNKLKEFLGKYDIILEAYCPLGHGDSALFEEPVLTELSKKYNKSVVQIILRWHIEENHIVIPKASSSKHIAENADIFDFELSDNDIQLIRSLNKEYRYFYRPDEEQEKIALSWSPNFDEQQ
ncbi:MAG: aldo/keto reductase [Oscillospiraceae bacterium]|nr:aldo/keto reductase [Oscillospiraceae bacterium]